MSILYMFCHLCPLFDSKIERIIDNMKTFIGIQNRPHGKKVLIYDIEENKCITSPTYAFEPNPIYDEYKLEQTFKQINYRTNRKTVAVSKQQPGILSMGRDKKSIYFDMESKQLNILMERVEIRV